MPVIGVLGVLGTPVALEEVLRDVLEDWGYIVAAAALDPDGLLLRVPVRLDVLVLGGLRVMDSLAVVRRLRVQPATAALPILLLVTSAPPPAQLAGLGPVEPVLLPFRLDELRRALARLCPPTRRFGRLALAPLGPLAA